MIRCRDKGTRLKLKLSIDQGMMVVNQSDIRSGGTEYGGTYHLKSAIPLKKILHVN